MIIDIVQGLIAAVIATSACVLLLSDSYGASLYSWLSVLTILLLLEFFNRFISGFEFVASGFELL